MSSTTPNNGLAPYRGLVSISVRNRGVYYGIVHGWERTRRRLLARIVPTYNGPVREERNMATRSPYVRDTPPSRCSLSLFFEDREALSHRTIIFFFFFLSGPSKVFRAEGVGEHRWTLPQKLSHAKRVRISPQMRYEWRRRSRKNRGRNAIRR